MPGMAIPASAWDVPRSAFGLILPMAPRFAPVGAAESARSSSAGCCPIVTLGHRIPSSGAPSPGPRGRRLASKMLGLQTWKPQERINASWGTMFLRGLAYTFLAWIPFAQLVSFFLFVSGKEHRALHDSIAGTIVLHDPNKILQPASVA